MFILTDGTTTNDYKTYILDSLLFTFTVHPSSVPMTEDYGFRYSEDMFTRTRIIVDRVDIRNQVTVKSAIREGNQINIILNIMGEEYKINENL